MLQHTRLLLQLLMCMMMRKSTQQHQKQPLFNASALSGSKPVSTNTSVSAPSGGGVCRDGALLANRGFQVIRESLFFFYLLFTRCHGKHTKFLYFSPQNPNQPTTPTPPPMFPDPTLLNPFLPPSLQDTPFPSNPMLQSSLFTSMLNELNSRTGGGVPNPSTPTPPGIFPFHHMFALNNNFDGMIGTPPRDTGGQDGNGSGGGGFEVGR